MASNFNEFMDEFNVHTSTSNSNPHKVSSKQIYGKDLTKTVSRKPTALVVGVCQLGLLHKDIQ